MTTKQDRVIKVFKELTQTRVVFPSYGLVAKKAKVSKATAHQVIVAWRKQNQTFGLKENL